MAQRPSLDEEIGKLTRIARGKGAANVARIPAGELVVSEWVRFKCRFGCKGYGKHLSCPPYTPTPAETRRMVAEYSSGILIRFDGIPGHPDLKPEEIPEDFHPFYRDLILLSHRTTHLLEKTAFYDGFYRAFGFGAYPCLFCEHEHCVAEEMGGIVDESVRRLCRHKDLVRPSMEAVGMDVFATAAKVGWEISTIPCKDLEYGKIVHGNIRTVCLVLLE